MHCVITKAMKKRKLLKVQFYLYFSTAGLLKYLFLPAGNTGYRNCFVVLLVNAVFVRVFVNLVIESDYFLSILHYSLKHNYQYFKAMETVF